MNDRYLDQMNEMEQEQREFESSQFDYFCESDREEYEKSQEVRFEYEVMRELEEEQAEMEADPFYSKWMDDYNRKLQESDMKIGEVYVSTGTTLKADDLKGKETSAKIETIEIKEFKEGNKLILHFVGKEKTLVLNKTNAGAIAHVLGDDTDDWIGKDIIIYPTTTDFGGEIVPCIRVRVQADFDDDIHF